LGYLTSLHSKEQFGATPRFNQIFGHGAIFLRLGSYYRTFYRNRFGFGVLAGLLRLRFMHPHEMTGEPSE